MMKSSSSPPVALSIAGFDGSAGAGVLADCRTFERLGVYGVSGVTAIAAQSPGHVASVEPVSPEVLRDQLLEISSTFRLGAAKTGMLGSPAVLDVVVEFFEQNPEVPLVIDPVLSSTAGPELTPAELIGLMTSRLFPLAKLVTPNRSEAETLLGRKINSLDEMQAAVLEINDRFGVDCLLKGGHFEPESNEICDVLAIDRKIELLKDERLAVADLHGTGCVLSAAIAAHLAKGSDMITAVKSARSNLRKWMENHHSWNEPREVQALNAVDRAD